jgi:hypothetical protein
MMEGGMTAARWLELEKNGDATLTLQEMQNGWHFCMEFDYLCTQGEERNEDGSCHYCGFDGRKVTE